MNDHKVYDLTMVHLFKCILNSESRAVKICFWPPHAI